MNVEERAEMLAIVKETVEPLKTRLDSMEPKLHNMNLKFDLMNSRLNDAPRSRDCGVSRYVLVSPFEHRHLLGM